MSGSDVLTERLILRPVIGLFTSRSPIICDRRIAAWSPAGDRLPSEAELVRYYGVTHMTARSALKLLQSRAWRWPSTAAGCTSAPCRRCGGWHLTGSRPRHRKEGKAAFTVEAEQAGAAPGVDMIKVSKARPPAEIADRLQLGKDASGGGAVPALLAGWQAGRDGCLVHPGRPG